MADTLLPGFPFKPGGPPLPGLVERIGEGKPGLPLGDSPPFAPWRGYPYALSEKRAEAGKVIDIMRAQEQKAFASPYGIAADSGEGDHRFRFDPDRLFRRLDGR